MALAEDFPTVDVVETLTDETLAGLAQAARRAGLGGLTGPAVHEINNWLFGIFAQAELLLLEPGLDPATAERLRTITDSATSLKQMLRRLGAAAREESPSEPVPLEETVRSVLELPGFAESSVTAPATALTPAGAAPTVADVVFHVLVALVGGAPAIELRQEGEAVVLEARATRATRSRLGSAAVELGLAVAGALARGLDGSLERGADGALRLTLPLV